MTFPSQSTYSTQTGREGRPRKRRSRWSEPQAKINLPNVPTVLPAGLSTDQLDGYVIHVRLDEINTKLRTGDYIPAEQDRSPSPTPVYGADGKRINTREYRYRKKLEDERHKLVDEGLRKIPGFKPPADYKRPSKVSDKLYIPAKDYPEINFIGQLIGPRGSTLKSIESESGAKISIRGHGSVKDGKSRPDGTLAPGEEEDLHCLVTADSEEKVKIAMKAIEKVIETAASVPEDQNAHKRMQLRKLAELNGTLRDDENQTCPNCGNTGHRRFECPEAKNFTVNLVCRICNGAGHTARDCMQRNDPEMLRQADQRDEKLDSELANLMAELGEQGPGGTPGQFQGRPGGPPGGGGSRPPWATGGAPGSGSSAAPPWAQNSMAMAGPPGAGAPWQHDPSAPMPPGYGPPGMGPPGMAPPGTSHPPPHGAAAPWSQPPAAMGGMGGGYHDYYQQQAYGGYDYYGQMAQQHLQQPPPPPPPAGGDGIPPPPPPAPAWAPPPPPPSGGDVPPPPPPQ
ncbi:hypothetical protein DFS34DRAFT_95154 [Phlyctochytrium arcticum]|nr:hypothetical protein DFS34DRAFT_95154 [Phlyctochytrium arcticum]